jgi:hypothetical protein
MPGEPEGEGNPCGTTTYEIFDNFPMSAHCPYCKLWLNKDLAVIFFCLCLLMTGGCGHGLTTNHILTYAVLAFRGKVINADMSVMSGRIDLMHTTHQGVAQVLPLALGGRSTLSPLGDRIFMVIYVSLWLSNSEPY